MSLEPEAASDPVAVTTADPQRLPPTVFLRDADEDDVEALRAIYADHVDHGTGSFETTAPGVGEMAERRRLIVARHLPYLVAGFDHQVLGFAYAAPFRPRPAYRFTVEDSIYLHPDVMGRGLGRLLLGHLIDRCQAMGYRQMVAVIGDSQNRRSIRLHEAMGFHRAGTFKSVGFKFGRWLDAVFMQRSLGESDGTLPPDS